VPLIELGEKFFRFDRSHTSGAGRRDRLPEYGILNVPAGLFAGTVVLAFGQALAFPALMTLAVNSAPASERSSVVGTFTAFTELGFAVGALSLGAIASAVGYDGVFVVCAIGPLIGTLLLARIAAPRATPVLDPA